MKSNIQYKHNKALSGGKFLSWLDAIKASQKAHKTMEVPCGTCTACCTSSYFIHVKPDETEALSRIPDELLFPAPGMPEGHMVMGYDQQGHCPMFKNNKCSIYEHRPQTCRKFDCRIFTATGLREPENRYAIIDRAGRWKFDLNGQEGSKHLTALRAAARFLIENKLKFPKDFVPENALQQADMAIRVYEIFFNYGYDTEIEPAENDKIVQAILNVYEAAGS